LKALDPWQKNERVMAMYRSMAPDLEPMPDEILTRARIASAESQGKEKRTVDQASVA
jgi:hypothetical protein